MPVHLVAQELGTRARTYFYHIEDGWQYHLSYERDASSYFKCVRQSKGCLGRATYDRAEGFLHSSPHDHDADIHYPDEMAMRRNVLSRCENMEYITYQNIILEEGRKFPPEVRARVTFARMRTPMRNARMQRFPPPPATLEDLTAVLMNPQYSVLTMTHDGLDNIYSGSVTDTDGFHHILFMSRRMIELARQLAVIHSDGTFKTVPISAQFADQVFALVGTWNHHIIPLGWALMSRRTEAAYTAVLQLLSNLLGPNVVLRKAVTDFETAQQNAWEEVFGIIVQGCLWHLCRAYIQQVAELSLINQMKRVVEVRKIIRLTMALALLPEDMILQGFQVIRTHARQEGRFIYRIVRPYLLYLWTNWVSRHWRRARMSVFGSSTRTNNACESQNRMLHKEVGTHPNVYLFIGGLIRLEQRSFNTVMSLEQGRRVSPSRKRTSILNDKRVKFLSDELINNPPGNIERSIYRFLCISSHTMDGMVEQLLETR